MDLNTIKDWLELLSYAAAVIGIPAAIFVYYNDKVKERKLKEKEALFTSYSLYADYLKICMENPELNVYNSLLKTKEDSLIEKKELIIFEILFTYLESSYLYYKDQSNEIKNKRWDGWIKYIEEFSKEENFRKAWELTGGQWDKDFMKLMNGIVNRQ